MHGIKNVIVLVGITSLALALMVTAPSSAERRVTLYIDGFGARVEPNRVVVSPGSACAPAAKHLNFWRRWGADITSSRGQLYFSAGPHCIVATRQEAGRVVLSRLRRCPSGLHYLRIRFDFFNHRSDYRTIDVKCDGYLAPSS